MGARGWEMSENIGISVVNPRTVAKAEKRKSVGAEVFSRPMPGYSALRLAAVHYLDGPLEIRLRGDMNPAIGVEFNWDRELGTFDDSGFHATDNPIEKYSYSPSELLCAVACYSVARLEGPKQKELIRDGYWQRFLEELPGVLLTGDVHLS